MANKANTKRKLVLASGVFDLLHLGHVRFLEDAKKAGGTKSKLIVIIARDSTAQKTKGRKPIMNEDERRSVVESLRVVDKAILGYEGLEIGEVIEKIKPDVIALGYDQTDMENEVKAYLATHKLDISVIRLGKFEENSLVSSSKIKQKIIDKLSK